MNLSTNVLEAGKATMTDDKKKFGFSLDFEEEREMLIKQKLDQQEKRREIERQRQADAEKLKFDEAEFDQIKQEEFQKGLEAGKSEQKQAQEQTQIEILEHISKQFEALQKEVVQHEENMRVAFLNSLLSVVRMVVPEMIDQNKEKDMEAFIIKAFEECHKDSDIEALVAEADYDTLKPLIRDAALKADIKRNDVKIKKQSDIAPGQCVVQWRDGGIEFNAEQYKKDITNALEQTFQSINLVVSKPEDADIQAEAVDEPVEMAAEPKEEVEAAGDHAEEIQESSEETEVVASEETQPEEEIMGSEGDDNNNNMNNGEVS